VTGIVIDSVVAGRLYASTAAGPFKSIDDGAHWTPFSAGLANPFLNCIVSDSRHRILYAGTYGQGVVEYSFFGPRELVVPVTPPPPKKVKGATR
jgi:hypothetical protein